MTEQAAPFRALGPVTPEVQSKIREVLQVGPRDDLRWEAASRRVDSLFATVFRKVSFQVMAGFMTSTILPALVGNRLSGLEVSLPNVKAVLMYWLLRPAGRTPDDGLEDGEDRALMGQRCLWLNEFVKAQWALMRQASVERAEELERQPLRPSSTEEGDGFYTVGEEDAEPARPAPTPPAETTEKKPVRKPSSRKVTHADPAPVLQRKSHGDPVNMLETISSKAPVRKRSVRTLLPLKDDDTSSDSSSSSDLDSDPDPGRIFPELFEKSPTVLKYAMDPLRWHEVVSNDMQLWQLKRYFEEMVDRMTKIGATEKVAVMALYKDLCTDIDIWYEQGGGMGRQWTRRVKTTILALYGHELRHKGYTQQFVDEIQHIHELKDQPEYIKESYKLAATVIKNKGQLTHHQVAQASRPPAVRGKNPPVRPSGPSGTTAKDRRADKMKDVWEARKQVATALGATPEQLTKMGFR